MESQGILLLFLSLPMACYSLYSTNDIVQFEEFKAKFGKEYGTPHEEFERFEIFAANLREVESHNYNGLTSFKKGVNQFSDRTQEEFESINFGYKSLRMHSESSLFKTANIDGYSMENLPKSVDWRTKGAVTTVKNQGQCGSCWAHAAVETIESFLQINTGELMELSVQQITSCAPNVNHCGGNGGCEGSIPQLGFVYAQLYGLNSESQYPYVSGKTQHTEQCHFSPHNVSAKVTLKGYEILPRNNMTAFMAHLAYKGPLAISVAASNLREYSSGVFDGCSFNKNMVLNHEIQLVGYGEDEDLGEYWIARNSWGPNWGENGYIRFKRYDHVTCGKDTKPKDGSGCDDDGFDEFYVCGECGLLFEGVYPVDVQFMP